ncbi:unnamed protein product [Spirodela intermedia]|uniref:Uncharacterized protein n=1 Tax=Spirodela intermedia TaxID=51605 RepID=A0A7I8LCE6_SPIIN|nr:unnamed protein product [Spirodela intermedia]
MDDGREDMTGLNMENNEECHQVQTAEIIGESSTRGKSYKWVMRPSSSKWTVELIDPVKNIYHLGIFNTLDEAATMYNNVAGDLSQKAECSTSSNMHDMDLVDNKLHANGICSLFFPKYLNSTNHKISRTKFGFLML